MHFNSDTQASARFMRTDTKESVEVYYDPSCVAPHPDQMPLMQKIMQGVATADEKKKFGELWQLRVEKILCSTKEYDTLIKVVSL
jgi:hypothetical protein